MGVESRHEIINGGQVLNNFVHLTESATLTVNQQAVTVTTGAAVDVTVTLPIVSEAMGRTFTIQLIVDGGFDGVVQDQDESDDWTDLTLDTADDYAVLYSDGRRWWVLASEVA